MPERKQGVAIIGAGMVADTHLRALAELAPAVEVVGVYTRTPDRARAFAARAAEVLGHDIEVFSGLDAAVAHDAVTWALVLTPPDARQGVVEAFAGAGKAVLLEKPVERTLANAVSIVETCERLRVPLGVVFQHRTRQASRRLASMIAAGELGALALGEAVVPWWRAQAYYDEPGRGTFTRDGGGVLISQAIHTLDLLMALAGRVVEVQAMAATSTLHDMEAEDYVVSGLRFENGAIGSLIASTASYPGAAESVTLHFERAVVRLASGVLHIEWRDGQSETLGDIAGTGGGADPMAFTHDWHRDVLADFVDALTKGRPPMVTGRAALKVHALIDGLIQSSREKRAVTINYPEKLT